MGQSEIIELLEKANKPLARCEICALLGEDGSKISHTLKKLVKYKEVKYVELDRSQIAEFYGGKKPKRRMKLYYL